MTFLAGAFHRFSGTNTDVDAANLTLPHRIRLVEANVTESERLKLSTVSRIPTIQCKSDTVQRKGDFLKRNHAEVSKIYVSRQAADF